MTCSLFLLAKFILFLCINFKKKICIYLPIFVKFSPVSPPPPNPIFRKWLENKFFPFF